MNEYWQVFTDGGARGNPGHSGVGVLIEKCGNSKCVPVVERHRYIGQATNNQAEYQALLLALDELLKLPVKNELTFHLDSRLVVEQVNKNYKIKNPELKILLEKVWQQMKKIEVPVRVIYIPRARNVRADKLANQAMDEGIAASAE